MHPILILAAAAAAEPRAEPAVDTIVVTASREPVAESDATSPLTVIREGEVEGPAAQMPMVADVLRTVPGVSVSISGPRGSQAQVRIRGAEANHTLLFVDGIRFNDPAAGNEARFELLGSEGVERVDIIRGPLSALWGSEAIGGVVAVYTNGAPSPRPRFDAAAEYGTLGSARAWASATGAGDELRLGGTAGWQKSEGIDAFGSRGERDGYENRSASLKAVYRPDSSAEMGAVGHWTEGVSEYDGFDPLTFRRADTLDETRNRIGAGRLWGEIKDGGWSAKLDASLLASANRNRLGGKPLNSTFGRRITAGGQISRRLKGHRVTAAVEHHAEDFRARDQVFFGGTDQDRSRTLVAAIGEWHAEWNEALTTDVTVRRDSFSAFADATTFHAGAVLRPAGRWRLTASYAEGLAQPTFYDLYGFFPGSFAGNPALRPERAQSWQAALKWEPRWHRSLTLSLFSDRLSDEIVDVFDPATFRSSTANASGTSRRRGVEAEAEWRFGKKAFFRAGYTWLDAEERQAAGGLALREARRPKHSATLTGYGSAGPLRWGATLAYVGKRGDTDFDTFPSRPVNLGAYLLASAQAAWRISPMLEAYLRAENAFDADYQDAFGYNTAGRTVHAGLRLRFGG
jgi:vitamin B12 transporter